MIVGALPCGWVGAQLLTHTSAVGGAGRGWCLLSVHPHCNAPWNTAVPVWAAFLGALPCPTTREHPHSLRSLIACVLILEEACKFTFCVTFITFFHLTLSIPPYHLLLHPVLCPGELISLGGKQTLFSQSGLRNMTKRCLEIPWRRWRHLQQWLETTIMLIACSLTMVMMAAGSKDLLVSSPSRAAAAWATRSLVSMHLLIILIILITNHHGDVTLHNVTNSPKIVDWAIGCIFTCHCLDLLKTSHNSPW